MPSRELVQAHLPWMSEATTYFFRKSTPFLPPRRTRVAGVSNPPRREAHPHGLSFRHAIRRRTRGAAASRAPTGVAVGLVVERERFTFWKNERVTISARAGLRMSWMTSRVLSHRPRRASSPFALARARTPALALDAVARRDGLRSRAAPRRRRRRRAARGRGARLRRRPSRRRWTTPRRFRDVVVVPAPARRPGLRYILNK